MTKLRAALCRTPNAPLSIEELTLRPLRGREVQVRLAASAICHSDISFVTGDWDTPLPALFGHEAAGRITATGPGVTGLETGMSVIATLMRACGTCPCCAAGRSFACDGPPPDHSPLTDMSGAPVATPMQIGGFADSVVVDQSQIAPVPASLSPAAASLLACGVITGVGAVVNSALLRPGEDVVVIGAGGVGLNAIQGARIAGARRIVAVDMVVDKLDAARAFGATDGVLASDGAPWDAARAVLGRGADAVIVTVGAARAYGGAPHYLARGGRIVAVGMPPTGAVTELELTNLASAGQSIIGSKMGDTVLSRDIPWLVDLYEQGRLKLDELVSTRWPLDRIDMAIADTRAGAARRNVIVFDD